VEVEVRFRVKLICLSELAISLSRAVANEAEALKFIPGAVWRGALAAQLIEEGELSEPETDETFHLLFLSGLVRFGDLRPPEARPWPLSARCCKMNERHPFRDLLIKTARRETLAPECAAPDTHKRPCGAKLDHPDGYFKWEAAKIAQAKSVSSRVLTHTAISNSLLRVRQEQFFSNEALEAGQSCEGELWAEPAADKAIRELFAGARIVTIGRGRTRGMGIAELSCTERESPDRTNDIKNRLTELNRTFGSPDHIVFTATMLSACVVFDRWLFSRPQLGPADIDPGLAGYTLKAAYSRMTTLSGWNAQAGLPKPDIAAIAPGACFLFAKEVARSEKTGELDRLAGVLAPYGKSLGEYWEEGLGEVEYCSPFHFNRAVLV
jgi:hypothetical protein